MTSLQHKALKSALEWYADHGVDEALLDAPVNRKKGDDRMTGLPNDRKEASLSLPVAPLSETPLLGKSDARAEAIRLAQAAGSLDELRAALESFEGLAIKKTATNLVFSDGNAKAPVMLVGEAPGADEDRQGKPFVGVSGQLLDRILKAIDLDRKEEETPEKAVYISNILNWRPPGNRTPSDAEVAASLPFIEKHIMLARPKILILCGGVSAKALLGSGESVSRLRRKWHEYTPLTRELGYDGPPIPAIVTYHPAFLLRTPSQKREAWNDMLALLKKMRETGIR